MSRPQGGARVGTRFGPYELRSLLGVGGMGEVYQAYDTRKGRMVALKLLRSEFAADPSFQQRFRWESERAARLQEPHVIPVHDFGQIDGVLFIDMRLVNGGSLKDLLRARGALEPARAVSIISQVASALDAAHSDGLVHRDVKPENVLLTAEDFAYLVDFGIARAGNDPSVTASGSLLGSCAYMAPERFDKVPIGPQADVYSLACVLYECLTGEPPFPGTEAPQLMTAHLMSPPPRPSIMRRGINTAFDDVIAIGMAKRPDARFASAGELARAASDALGVDSPAPVSRPSQTRPFSTRYESPDNTGFSPYPPAMSAPQSASRRPGYGRTTVIVGGVAATMLVLAAILGAILVIRSTFSRSTPAAEAPPQPTTATPSLSRPVDGADGLGFIGHSARCDPGNPPAMVVRTAQSLVVICQAGTGSYYYRGERIRDGANIELANAVRTDGGFDVTNPANGVRYEVRPQQLTILSGSHVDSAEPVLQYATAN